MTLVQPTTGIGLKASSLTNITPKIASQTQVNTNIQAKVKPETLVQTQTKAQTQTQTQTEAKTETAIGTNIVSPPTQPTKGITTNIIILTNRVKDLSEKEKKGLIAWKQGSVYKIWFYPYGENDLKTSGKPIFGVIYAEGLGSVQKSIVQIGDMINRPLKHDLGIVKIDIPYTGMKTKPDIKFDADLTYIQEGWKSHKIGEKRRKRNTGTRQPVLQVV